MKSVVALLVLVALCTAEIVKDGGLKGSWEDTFELVSTFDTVAPVIGYSGTSDLWYNTPSANLTNYDANEYYSNSITFAITDAARFYDMGTVEVSFVTGTDADSLVYEPEYCTLSSDNTVYCSVRIYGNTGTYSYSPVITATDEQGNWATATAATFTDEDRPAVLEIQDNTPDMTAPVIVEDSEVFTGAAVTLPAGTDYTTWSYVDLSVDVHDNTDPASATYDMYASDILGVWAVIVDMADEDTEWSELLTYDDGAYTQTWGATFGFANWAPLGEWRVRRFTASDRAGNWAEEYSVDTAITVEWSDSNEDEVTSCQTFLYDITSNPIATGSYAEVTFTPGCTVKYSGSNYVYASFQSPEYVMKGDTLASTRVVGTWYGGTYYDTYPAYDAPSYFYNQYLGYHSYTIAPGVGFSGDGTASVDIRIYDGGKDGEWSLYELVTFTGTGAVQRYTVELGAASSVVPSAIAVVLAAVFAMFRL